MLKSIDADSRYAFLFKLSTNFMDLEYLLLNSIIYGYVSLLISSFFAYKRYINFALAGIFIAISYLVYNLTNNFLEINNLVLFISILALYFGVDYFVYNSFKQTKKRELFSIIFSLGLFTFIENILGYNYGSGIIELSIYKINTETLLTIFILLNILLIYLLRFSLVGKVFLATFENSNIVKSLGININKLLFPYIGFLLILGFLIAFINLNENVIRSNDGIFYLLKGLGIMVLVGLTKIHYIFLGSMIYVICEYLLFVKLGISITYKESLILIIILLLLIFKPNGIFTLRNRRV